MDVYVRLYWQHDLDLISLHYSPSIPKVGALMKAALPHMCGNCLMRFMSRKRSCLTSRLSH